jgi:hypothetical protein
MAQEDWTNRKWRPYMAWMYMIVCILDFTVFPILWSILQAYYDGQVTSQWDPLTLKGAGLFHMAMGAVLGVAAWSRGQEKIANASTIPTSPPPTLKPIPTTTINTSSELDPPFRNTRND